MDSRPHERHRQALHGLVSPRLRLAMLLLGAAALVAAVAGGLLRAGAPWPVPNAVWGTAAALHAALVFGFFGVVIGIERAVAVRHPAAYGVPLLCGLGGLLMLGGRAAVGAALLVVASCGFVGVNVLLVRRQQAAHTAVLLLGAAAWLVGNVLFAWSGTAQAATAWWFAFLVLTITAERLEMARLMRRRAGTQEALFALIGLLLFGAGIGVVKATAGGVIYGAALGLLAAWLLLFDIARRTVFAHGLSRYMAVCLLGGYAWLALAGAAWAATALGWPWRDASLHALGLGFVVSMVMGHAPVILPAVARVKLRFGWAFYVPLALLHASLLLRLGLGAMDASSRRLGAELNAAALVLFVLTVLGAALAERNAQRLKA